MEMRRSVSSWTGAGGGPAAPRSRQTAGDAGARLLVAAGAALALLTCGRSTPPPLPAGFDPSGSDPRAIDVARRAGKAMGGEAGWAATRYLTFDFVVEAGGAPPVAYRHYWDVSTGRYRVEGMDEERRPYLVLFNVNTRKGIAWIDGRPAHGAERAHLLEEGYGRFINDCYWLLMPLKLLDPGTHLHYEGEVKAGGSVRDRIRVTFDAGIGLTPGDTYWAEVDRRTGRMERWEFMLQGDKAKYGYRWTGWERFGPLTLSSDKEAEDGSDRIRFVNVRASEVVDPAPFEVPSEAGERGPA
jgi:hypothetical protein